MRRVFLVLLASSLTLSGVFLVLNSVCPMVLDGPGYVIHRTQSDIRLLRAAVMFYRLDHNELPGALPDLVEAEMIEQLYPDYYGTDFNYRLEPDGAEFVIYSSGRNRIDEFGGGDDIVLTGKEYDCPMFYRCPTLCERVRDAVFLGAVLAWPATLIALLVWMFWASTRYLCHRLR